MRRLALIAAVALGVPAYAQESGGYIRGFIGTPILGSAGLKAPAGTADQNTNQPFCDQSPQFCASDRLNGSIIASGDVKAFSGIDFGVAAGWRLNSSFRGELALDFRNIDIDIPDAVQNPPAGVANRIPEGALPYPSAANDDQIWTVMVNGIYDILFDPGQIVDPYVGVGVGWANTTVTAYNTEQVNDTTQARLGTPANGINNTSASGFAFNLLAGLSYEFAEGVSGTLEYKYTNMFEVDIDGIDRGNTVKYRVGHSDHLITVGIAYNFGGYTRAAPPPPAPLPPPRPVAPPQPPEPVFSCADQDQSVVVYFGLNKTDLTQEDEDSIANALRAARQNSCSVSDVSIVGYTDRAGNAAYNLALSEKRGDAVRQIVIGQGVNAALIEVTGAGEMDTARPSEDGKVDALSRRAEIYIRAQ